MSKNLQNAQSISNEAIRDRIEAIRSAHSGRQPYKSELADVLAFEELLALRAQLAELCQAQQEPVGYFAYSDDIGFETFTTAAEAIKAAQAEIDAGREGDEGWPEEVESVRWGIVVQRAKETDAREVKEGDGFPSWVKQACDYELSPPLPIQTIPSTPSNRTSGQVNREGLWVSTTKSMK